MRLQVSGAGLSEKGILALREAIPDLAIDAAVPSRGLPGEENYRLPSINGISQCEHLDLRGSFTTDATLACLEAATNLNYLVLNRTSISDAGLAHLRRLESLEAP